jgi:RNA polymerase sigma factor (TIGR02999 family)
VYEELRKLAAARLCHEPPGISLQATVLVHEAYLRLVENDAEKIWDSRGHFFAAAAEAMRRILVEAARRRKSLKRGGHLSRQEVVASQIAAPEELGDIEALDQAIDELATFDPKACEVVKLRCFAGLTHEETAEILKISRTTVARLWAYGRAWLRERIR